MAYKSRPVKYRIIATFNWNSSCNCACAQYAKSIGQYVSWDVFCGGNWEKMEGAVGIWEKINRIAYRAASKDRVNFCGTFGDVLTLARAERE